MPTPPGIAPPSPLPVQDRASILFIENGLPDLLDGAFVGARMPFAKPAFCKELITGIGEMLAAGGLPAPTPHVEPQPVAIPQDPSEDVGHRA